MLDTYVMYTLRLIIRVNIIIRIINVIKHTHTHRTHGFSNLVFTV